MQQGKKGFVCGKQGKNHYIVNPLILVPEPNYPPPPSKPLRGSISVQLVNSFPFTTDHEQGVYQQEMPSPWESTAALVDARFCKGHTTTLTVTRSKSSRGYGLAVTDAAGGAVVM